MNVKLHPGLLVCAIVGAVLATPSGQSPQVEWFYYGGDAASSKFSPAGDITRQNVERLGIAWQWEPGEKPLEQYGTVPMRFENQPLMVDGVLYVTTAYNNAAALDAETGKELWRFDAEAVKLGAIPGSGFKHRAPALWRDSRDGNRLRVLLNTRNQLFSLDAQTGRPVASFGTNGVVSLTDAYPRPISDVRHVNHGASPPVVYRDIVVVGSSIPDRYQLMNEPPGIVQGFDARSGRRLWVWNAIPQSATDFGASTWEEGSWRFTGHANVWGPMTVDATRGLLYFGTSTPGNDYYGGRRLGKNEPAESIVCLDITTGQRKWSFQMIHHGLWDFDNPAAPNLVTIAVDGKRLDGVAQVTKQGFTYVFDRVTGEPVWPIVERAVPTDTDVPGEKVWPTQPFPTRPPAFARQGVSLDDANDLTPEVKELAQAEMKKYRIGPLFTPPTLRGTLQLPGDEGGANWGGAIWDAETGRLYVRSKDVIRYSRIIASDGTDKFIDHAYSGHLPAPRPGTPLGAIPLIRPPWARLTAIDLNKGDIVWQVPVGEGSAAVRNHPLLKSVKLPDRLGSPSNGGSVLTGSGLIFVGGGDGHLYAFEKDSGRELWRGRLPYVNAENVMTYRTRAGRQFVLASTGAGADAALVAFALESGAPSSGAASTSAAPTSAAPTSAAPTSAAPTSAAPTTAAAGARGQNPSPTPGASSGQAAFDRVCSVCHGREARGDAGPRLVPFSREYDELLAIVREGKGQMPPISARDVSDDNVSDIAAYLKALSR
ncbi:MAG: pyrroloquinoline quinone-dependent dehydrogenase [Acidobacteria bacterium]|nr:MAG: pyrroloquinoline quinone-dependent dehydrogenase [Acidobacteriota bacterium]